MDESSPHYTVLARRYRPQTFSEVVGQAPVAQALKNAIAAGRVAHAYLFTGARGVGKTSMARILAKALDCPNAHDGISCNACEICAGISAGQDVDVIEIDGASNRRIDDVRMLRSNVGVKPMRARYKIYIIDEVHMLTNEAFNALLKTLEEPPPNVKFIFCTTEPNKVPDTILSRCQRFDFAAIETQKIIERLQAIAAAEGYEIEPAALDLVARRARGSLRDSQSLFDQLLAYGGKTISAADVHRLLGTASDDRLVELAGAIVARQSDRALGALDAALADGVQLDELVDQLLDFARDMMVTASGAQSTALLSVSPAQRSTLAELGRRWGLPTIVNALEILSETKTRMQRSGHGRALAELALVRLTLLETTMDLAALVDELRQSEPGKPVGKGVAPATPRHTGVGRTIPAAAEPVQGSRPGEPQRATPRRPSEQPEPTVPTVASPQPPTIDLEQLAPGNELDMWSQLVSRLGVRDMLADAVEKVVRVAISGPNQLEIVFPGYYHLYKGICEQAANRTRLEKLAAEMTGRPMRLVFRLDEQIEGVPRPVRQVQATEEHQGTDTSDPYVERARSIFGATVRRVEPLRKIGDAEADGPQEE